MLPLTASRGILTGILTAAMAVSVLPDAEPAMSDLVVRGTDTDAVAAAVVAHGGEVEFEIGLIDAVSARVPTSLVDELTADARTIDVTPDAPVQLLSLTDASLTDTGTVLEVAPTTTTTTIATTTSTVTGITGAAAADVLSDGRMAKNSFDGTGIDVALVDSGVDTSAVSGVKPGIDVSLSSTARDGYGHGTAMAGIIRSVAPDAGIVDVKVADDRGVVDVSQVLAGIDWAVTNRNTGGRNIRVLSLSFGTDGSNPASTSPLVYAVEAAWRHGITAVVAAGNHGTELGRLTTPAISPWVIAVGAADTRGMTTDSSLRGAGVPSWSAHGNGVRNPDIIMPGRSILGGLAKDSAVARANPDAIVNGQIVGSGTSQATAFTAGVVAAIHEARSGLSPDEVKALMIGAAEANTTAPARQAGAGLVDLDRLFGKAHLAGRVKGIQAHAWSNGTGSLDGDRGRFVLQDGNGNLLTGQNTPVGPFNGSTWTGSTWTGSTWTGSTWTGSTWTGSTWTGSTWTGSTWTGSTWTGSTWTNVRWGQ